MRARSRRRRRSPSGPRTARAGANAGPAGGGAGGAAEEAFAIGPEDDAGAVYAVAAEVAARLLDGVLDDPRPTFVPQAGVATYAEKIRPEDRRLTPAPPAGAAGP